MSSSREGFDLFHKAGRYHFGKYFPYLKWNLVFEYTFSQFGCWIIVLQAQWNDPCHLNCHFYEHGLRLGGHIPADGDNLRHRGRMYFLRLGAGSFII